MKLPITKNNQWVIYLISFFLFFLIILLLSDGFYGGGDNITHYRYARWAYIHPEFLLWHWGKPVFTLMTFPFAQFGFIGMQIFNILCATASAYIIYLIAKKLDYNNAPLSILFLAFLPSYTIIAFSGMTEILFGLIGILSTSLFIRKKHGLMAGLNSFIILVRTEGIILLPIYGFASLLKKKYKILPFFLLCFILYSVIGYFYYDDFFWLITKMPYRGAVDKYGTGPLSHYFIKIKYILGIPLTLFTSIGIINIIIRYLKQKSNSFYEFYLILLPPLAFFFAHVIMWWSGVGNSNGNLRYFAAVMPYFALIALNGFNISLKGINYIKQGTKYIKLTFIAFSIIYTIIFPFKVYRLPTPLNTHQALVKECSDWLKTTKYIDKRFVYTDPDFIHFMDFNAYDPSISKIRVYNENEPHKHLNPGEIVIWDGHYNSDKLHDNLVNSEYFKLIKEFHPPKKVKYGKREQYYSIKIFQLIEN